MSRKVAVFVPVLAENFIHWLTFVYRAVHRSDCFIEDEESMVRPTECMSNQYTIDRQTHHYHNTQTQHPVCFDSLESFDPICEIGPVVTCQYPLEVRIPHRVRRRSICRGRIRDRSWPGGRGRRWTQV